VRGRGRALWNALITLVAAPRDDPDDARETRRVIGEVLADHEGMGSGSRPARSLTGYSAQVNGVLRHAAGDP